MNKAPVFEPYVQASKKPVGSVSILIGGQGTRDFTLVSEVSEVMGSLISVPYYGENGIRL